MKNDCGYFPRGTSMLRQVQEQRVVGLMYGQRALCIGALNPLTYVGTSENTAGRLTPWKRLAHTGKWFETVYFGSRDEADQVLAAVHRMHSRVRGALSQNEGPYRAGTRYDALHPELMLWTIAVMMDSSECLHDLLVRRLREDEREALWQDYVRFGGLFGMPRDAVPASYREFRDYYHATLTGDGLSLTEEARYVGHATAFDIPMPAAMQPAKAVHDLILLGSLPARVRRIYRLTWTPAHALAFKSAVRAVSAARRALPVRAKRGSNPRLFDVVAATEARRIEQGRPTPQLRPA
jgi:uncharacterized protein (DUF2236 family)